MTFSAHKPITIYSNQRPFEIIFHIFSGCNVVTRIRISNVRWCNKLCMRYFTYIRTWNNVTMSGTKLLLFLSCWCPVTYCAVDSQLISWQGSSYIYLASYFVASNTVTWLPREWINLRSTFETYFERKMWQLNTTINCFYSC